MTRNARARLESLRFVMNEVYTLGMMAVIAAVLTAAMVLQYVYGELPCPLCLLQRVAMLGVCFGLMQNFRNGFSDRNLGYSLLFSVFLLVISIRQTLLDIYPRPGSRICRKCSAWAAHAGVVDPHRDGADHRIRHQALRHWNGGRRKAARPEIAVRPHRNAS